MAMEIVLVDSESPDRVRVGAWEARGETITVVYLGTLPKSTAHLGHHADAPMALAKLLLSEFP